MTRVHFYPLRDLMHYQPTRMGKKSVKFASSKSNNINMALIQGRRSIQMAVIYFRDSRRKLKGTS